MKSEQNEDSKSKLAVEKRQRLEQEMETAQLIQQANEIKELTLGFGADGEMEIKSEIGDFILQQIDDPEEKYNLYYHTIDRILRKNLPKGEEFKEHRDLIYEEKNTFLTRGHRLQPDGRRHADSRQGYAADMQELVQVIGEWLAAGANMYDLYIRIRDLNKSKGYPLE